MLGATDEFYGSQDRPCHFLPVPTTGSSGGAATRGEWVIWWGRYEVMDHMIDQSDTEKQCGDICGQAIFLRVRRTQHIRDLSFFKQEQRHSLPRHSPIIYFENLMGSPKCQQEVLLYHAPSWLTKHVWICFALVISFNSKGYSHWACNQVDIELDYDGGWHTWAGKPRPLTTLSSASRQDDDPIQYVSNELNRFEAGESGMSRVPQRISRNLFCKLRRRAFTTTAERCLDRTRASTKVRAMAEKTLNIGEFKLAKPSTCSIVTFPNM